jgi:hypothetical protein
VTPPRSLFRQEAIEFQQHHRQWGEVPLLQRLSTKSMAWFITAAAALVLTFLFLGQYVPNGDGRRHPSWSKSWGRRTDSRMPAPAESKVRPLKLLRAKLLRI